MAKLLEAGLVKEIRVKAGALIWRRDEEKGHAYALKLTATGVKAIAVDETRPSQREAERRADHLMVSVDLKPEPGSAPAAFVDRANGGVDSTPKFPRRGTKISGVIELLQGSDGVTLAELVSNTGWLPHTARAALTGLRKRGYAVVIDRADKARGSVYRIEPSQMGGDSARHTSPEATGGARPDRPGGGASRVEPLRPSRCPSASRRRPYRGVARRSPLARRTSYRACPDHRVARHARTQE